MDKKNNRGIGITDPLDAHRIAMATLPLDVEQLRRPRLNEGIRQGLRILTTSRVSMSKDRTRSVNALNALVRSNALGIDARKKLTRVQIEEVSRWRERDEELSVPITKTETVRLAKHILELDAQLATKERQLDDRVNASEAAPLLEETGIGTMTAAKCFVAWSHEGRVRDEAAFACLAGVNPVSSSSRNTTRHRLNRVGDTTLNSALPMSTVVRMAYDDETRAYVEKRCGQGKTDKGTRRCIKRYLARRIFRILVASVKSENVQFAVCRI